MQHFYHIAATEMEFTVSDDFYRKHFLLGVLLREVESALQYEAGIVRRKTIRILRDLLAKHDSDSRYRDTVYTLFTSIYSRRFYNISLNFRGQ